MTIGSEYAILYVESEGTKMRIRIKFLVMVSVLSVGCTTANIQLAKASHPVRTLTQAYSECVGANISNTDVRKDCLELAKLEEHRDVETAKASATAQAAKAANPCGGCFMVASSCYVPGAPCGRGYYSGYYGAGYYGVAGLRGVMSPPTTIPVELHRRARESCGVDFGRRLFICLFKFLC